MSRTIPAAILTAISQPNVDVFFAVQLDFDAGALRLWTGHGDRVINGDTYTGASNLLNIDGLEEASDLSARSATLQLSGVPSSTVSIALTEPYQGRAANVYFGVQGETEVVEVFGGLMDLMTIEDDGESCTISLTVESKLVELERPNLQRYTQESQEALHPGDTFFSYVADIQDKDVVWGRSGD